MRKYIIFFIFSFLCSCNNIKDEVYYTYNDVTIKRIDTNGKSQFYYIKNGKESGEIWAEYSGINDGFAGYLKFEKNGKVLILSGDGYFQTKDNDTMIFDYKRKFSDEINYNKQNICKIWYPIEAEQEKNKKTKSKVKVKYVRH